MPKIVKCSKKLHLHNRHTDMALINRSLTFDEKKVRSVYVGYSLNTQTCTMELIRYDLDAHDRVLRESKAREHEYPSVVIAKALKIAHSTPSHVKVI